MFVFLSDQFWYFLKNYGTYKAQQLKIHPLTVSKRLIEISIFQFIDDIYTDTNLSATRMALSRVYASTKAWQFPLSQSSLLQYQIASDFLHL